MSYFRYTNQECPVCKRTFGENDDIVVCPVCGTPHHRECYKENGECGNDARHSEGFRWEAEQPSEAEQAPNGQPPVFDREQQNAGENPQFFANQPNNPFKLFPAELEEGVTTEEAAAFVQLNAFPYLQRFFHLKSGKRTWNWAAFFFSPYWFFARKMHKLGAIFLAVILAVNIGFSLLPPVVKYTNEIAAKTEEALESEGAEKKSFMEIMASSADEFAAVQKANPTGYALSAASSVLIFALRVAAALLANKLYYKHTLKSIKKIKTETPDDSRRKLMLFKLGGMSAGAPILAIMASGCATMALGLIM